MLFGRYWLAVPVLAIAGSLAAEEDRAARPGTLPTHTPLFAGLLVGVVHPGRRADLRARAGALGPIVEHLTLIAAR